jgi:hypothetical protein
MDCTLEQRADGLWHCKAGCGRKPYPKKVRQRCGHQPEPKKCLECGTALVRKPRLPEGLVWWRCEPCRKDIEPCRPCNAQAAAKKAAGQPKAPKGEPNAGTPQAGS